MYEMCKTVRKLLRDGIREYNTMGIKEAVETGKGLKKVTTKEDCKVMIPSLKEEDGSIITNRIFFQRCAEFYEKLYEDTVQNIVKVETEEVPLILTRKVERALSKMKSRKAPGEDQTVGEIIRTGGEIALRKIQELFNAVLRTETVPKEWGKCHHHTDIKEGR